MLPGIGWGELLLVIAIAIVVVGPKELPLMMRNIGRFMGKARAVAREFQQSFEDIAREAELEELRKEGDAIKRELTGDPMRPIARPTTPAVASTAPAQPLTPAEEAQLSATENAKVLAAETAAEPAPEPAPDAQNVTPFRGGARR